MKRRKQFPEGMTPLGGQTFTFRCHPGVSCFTVCCRGVDLDLYPYDVIRLRHNLGIESDRFMRTYAEVRPGANPYFPTVKLSMVPFGADRACPFLAEDGCSVYRDRPTACRSYPLERAVDRRVERGRTRDFYFLTRHDYCRGHFEPEEMTVRTYIRSQQLDRYNQMNDRWAEMDTLFSTNPWKGEGSGGPQQRLAFMVCYDIDGFRRSMREQRLLERYVVERDERRRLETDDEALLGFGFEWLKDILGGSSSLRRR